VFPICIKANFYIYFNGLSYLSSSQTGAISTAIFSLKSIITVTSIKDKSIFVPELKVYNIVYKSTGCVYLQKSCLYADGGVPPF